MSIDKIPARGPRGETVVIQRTGARPAVSSQGVKPEFDGPPSYHLGTGERLVPTADPKVFTTVDGKRRFTVT